MDFKSVRSKILPTVTVCGAALFLLSAQPVLADQAPAGQNGSTTVNTAVVGNQTNSTAQNASAYNHDDHGNYAWLDHVALDNKGQLNVAG